MDYVDSIILGIIEGITEFLPISSTGHLILAGELLGLSATDFYKTFEIAIQTGAIAAVLVLYWRSFLDVSTFGKLFVAFIPTGIIGFFAYGLLKEHLLGSPSVVVLALFVGGIVLIILELFHREPKDAPVHISGVTYLQSFWIGVFQALAIIPGVSRSGASIVGGLLLGLSRLAIVEFSFLLAVPTIAAATGYDLLKNGASITQNEMGLLAVGFLVSFIVAMIAIKFLLAFVRHYSFIGFGVYRILVALIFWFIIL